jgi:transcriptional regulator with XRE-family HTH domain
MAYHRTMSAEEHEGFAGELKRFREARGLPQRFFAACMKTAVATVGRLERGECAPFPQTVKRFEALRAKIELAKQTERVEEDGGKLEGFILREDLRV